MHKELSHPARESSSAARRSCASMGHHCKFIAKTHVSHVSWGRASQFLRNKNVK
jgi:hypothetical protein